MDTKQSPYRILYKRLNGTNLQLAVAETEKKADIAWEWIDSNEFYFLIIDNSIIIHIL